MTLFPAIRKILDEKGATDMILFGGGIIPDEDIEALEKQGIHKLFSPGASTDDIVEYVRSAVAKKIEEEPIL